MDQLQKLLDSVQTILLAVGGTIAVIALIAVGIKIIVSAITKGTIRDAMQGAGLVFLGVLLIGLAAVLVAAFMALARSIG